MSDSDLISAFLAQKGATLCPTRRGASPSMEWAGYEYNTTPAQLQPIPEAKVVRALAQRVKLQQRTRVVRGVAKSEGR